MEAWSLGEALAWVLSGGGAGVIAYFIVGKTSLNELGADYKRYASIAVTAALAIVAWGAGMGMNYLNVPVDWRGWVEAAFSVIAVALTTSQVIHGARDLRQRRLRE